MNEQKHGALNFIINLRLVIQFPYKHDMKFVMNICDKIYVQDNGKIISGTQKKLRKIKLLLMLT